MNVLGKRAVVIGAGVAGLSAARVLSDFYETVALLERDDDPMQEVPRVGVPQGRQPHLLMAGGRMALCAIFPGLEKDLDAAGAVTIVFARDSRTEVPGLGVLPQRDLDLAACAMPRPRLEQVLHRRLVDRENIVLLAGCRAIEIEAHPDGRRVTGVSFERPNGMFESLEADLVADASGRAAPTMACLETVGCPLPRQTYVGVDLGYSTMVCALPAGADLGFSALMTVPSAPQSSRGGYMLRIGEQRWQVLLVGRGDDCPPGDRGGYRAFARTLPSFTIAQALERAVPEGEITRYRFTGSLRRHFCEMEEFPEGLVPMGDALCRLNPVYGQGMSVAALEARLLQEVLTRRAVGIDRTPGLSADYLMRVEPLIAQAWSSSTIADFAYPQTIGERPADIEQQLRHQGEAYHRAMSDAEVHRRILSRHHLIDIEHASPSRVPMPA